jgi:hypothetical protein
LQRSYFHRFRWRGISSSPFIIFVIIVILVITLGSVFELEFAPPNTMHPVSYSGSFIFGVSGLTGSDYPASFISEVTSQYGITAFRIDNSIFSGPNGDQISKYVSNGARFIYANFEASTTDNPQTYANGIVATVQANPQISMVGLVNEPNCLCGSNGGYWTPRLYSNFLNAAYNALKQAGLKQPLCAFETSGDVGPQALSWIQQVIADGGAGHYDAVCVHVYPLQTYTTFSQAVNAISSNLDSLHTLVGTNVPIYITETNVSGGNLTYVYGNLSENTKTLISMFLTKPYIKGVFYYDLTGSQGLSLFTGNLRPTILATTYSSVLTSCDASCSYSTTSNGIP